MHAQQLGPIKDLLRYPPTTENHSLSHCLFISKQHPCILLKPAKKCVRMRARSD